MKVTILPSGWPYQISGTLIRISNEAELVDTLANRNGVLRLRSGDRMSYLPVRNVVSVIALGGESSGA